ncbi:DUF2182 domain-containing protein [Mycobacteroides sp. LB1]|uniref:copper chaperone n=1 Tax=Mycobacteroides sp. LB1 TaxID=2750814 RepID=UPI0015DD66A8|nr:DUF2182 domain-containing protein [Mycobacteroides sp. LB1]
MVANAIQRVRALTAGRYAQLATAVILLSWLGFTFLPQHGSQAHTAPPVAGHMHGMNHETMDPMAPMPAAHHPALWAAFAAWIVMTIAMMGPATLPAVQFVEQHAPRGRRGGAVALYAAVWLAVWAAVGIVITLAQSAATGAAPWWLFAGALLATALWQLTPLKCQALGDCHRSSPLPPSGWPAAKGVMRFGGVSGWACARSCWAVMLAMAVAPAAHVLLMVPLTAAVTWERFTGHPRRTTRILAVLFAAAAAAAAAFAALQ